MSTKALCPAPAVRLRRPVLGSAIHEVPSRGTGGDLEPQIFRGVVLSAQVLRESDAHAQKKQLAVLDA
jgi:hypothetical protein